MHCRAQRLIARYFINDFLLTDKYHTQAEVKDHLLLYTHLQSTEMSTDAGEG